MTRTAAASPWQVALTEPKKPPGPAAKGARGRVANPGPTISYLVRYTKWPRRPEEWVGEAFAYQWDEQLAKIVTNRPPRKQMWVEAKGAAAEKKAAEDGAGEASAAADAAADEGKAAVKSGRGSRGPTTADAEGLVAVGRGQRGKKLTEKGEAAKAASVAEARGDEGAVEMDEEDEMSGGLGALMKLGRKAAAKQRSEEDDEEGEEGEEGDGEDEDEEEEEEEEGEGEDDDEDGDSQEEEEEEDDMYGEEDEDEDMIRIARERAAEQPSMLMQMAEATAAEPKPKAEATHRRKGVPLKSIRPARSQLHSAAQAQAAYADHTKQMSMWQRSWWNAACSPLLGTPPHQPAEWLAAPLAPTDPGGAP